MAKYGEEKGQQSSRRGRAGDSIRLGSKKGKKGLPRRNCDSTPAANSRRHSHVGRSASGYSKQSYFDAQQSAALTKSMAQIIQSERTSAKRRPRYCEKSIQTSRRRRNRCKNCRRERIGNEHIKSDGRGCAANKGSKIAGNPGRPEQCNQKETRRPENAHDLRKQRC